MQPLTQAQRFLMLGLVLLAIFNLNACSHSSEIMSTPPNSNAKTVDSSEQIAFFNTLRELCGQRFIGKSSFPANPEDSFYDKTLVATFSSCNEEEIRVPFSVGNNHSRTWIIRMTAQGLQLKHQHLHEDGTPDGDTNYGGLANDNGSALSQFFPADEFTQQLIPAASTNVWNLSLSDDKQNLTYYLERHNKPRFKASLKRSDSKL